MCYLQARVCVIFEITESTMSFSVKWVVSVLVTVKIGMDLVTVGSSAINVTESPNKTESMLVKGQPCLDKYARLGSHTACLAPSPLSSPIEMTEDDIQLILETHNRYRSDVSPPATNMLKMSWDDEIAMIAQAWADNCSLGHDESRNRDIPGRLSLGQNVGDGFQSWTGVIDAWFVESYHFTYGSDNNVFEKIGHYTQGVWADSNKVGCGASRCGDIIFYVCNYGPAGNIEPINEPYKTGSTCSECPLHCEDKLCACGDLVCENGGSMVRDSCQCRCPHPWLVEPGCKLNCSAVQEPWYCGKEPFDRNSCVLYENVPHDCPLTCQVCPFGDWQYIEGSIPLFTTPKPDNDNDDDDNNNNNNNNNNNSDSSSPRPNNRDDTSAGVSTHRWRHQQLVHVLLALCLQAMCLASLWDPLGKSGS